MMRLYIYLRCDCSSIYLIGCGIEILIEVKNGVCECGFYDD